MEVNFTHVLRSSILELPSSLGWTVRLTGVKIRKQSHLALKDSIAQLLELGSSVNT